MSQKNSKPVVLTIAGLDPSGGAGVIRDIHTFISLGCYSTAAITSLTFQNDEQVWGAEHLSPETLSAQLAPIIHQYSVAGVKTGMLPTSEIVRAVARLVRETNLPAPVVDPLMRSTSGYALIEEGALETMVAELLPQARVITPNILEAQRLTGLRIVDEAGMRQAAAAIRALGAQAVLVKGGHLPEPPTETGNAASESLGPRASRPLSLDNRSVGEDFPMIAQPPSAIEPMQQAGGTPAVPVTAPEVVPVAEAIDVLDDEGIVTVFRSAWIASANVRGTGCMLSAAIAACLAKGMCLKDSVAEAKRFVNDSILRSGV